MGEQIFPLSWSLPTLFFEPCANGHSQELCPALTAQIPGCWDNPCVTGEQISLNYVHLVIKLRRQSESRRETLHRKVKSCCSQFTFLYPGVLHT